VRFDDRLLTVLSQPAGDRHDAAVRWRQLVDLVARAGPDSDSPVVARALEAIRADGPQIDENLRAAAARAIAGRPLPFSLLEYLVSDRLSVSAPVLAAATLDGAQWRALLGGADDETRQFIEALHSEVASSSPEAPKPELPRREERLVDSEVEESLGAIREALEQAPAPQPSPATRRAVPSLSDVVARIERRRRGSEARRRAADAEVPGEAPSMFRWECGPSGEIAWVEGAPRGALIGRSIARVQETDTDRVGEEVLRAFARRAPFRDADLTFAGEGLLAGAWKISGLPAFDPTDGRFAGYRGIAQRDSTPLPRRESAADMLADPDSLRELVHEIKTPLNAIIGFAEIIQGQYLGPADHRYRERAGEIVAQAGLLLGAIDDLDFAAKVHSAAGGSRRVDLGQLLHSAGETLAEAAAARGVELELAGSSGDCIAALEPEVADRLILRFGSAMIEGADAGEHLRIWIEQSGGQCRVLISRPASLRSLPDALLFEGIEAREEFSAGFTLRLVRGLARIAGGDLTASAASLALVVPHA
jgi:signal transduction histidine kinase